MISRAKLDSEIGNWVRWCWSGPGDAPEGSGCISAECSYIAPSDLCDVSEDDPPAVDVDSALIVQGVYDSMYMPERKVMQAEYVWRERYGRHLGIWVAACMIDVSPRLYLQLLETNRQKIRRAFG
ncbi:hypothetical protein [Paraburkholderia tuberum]|uniref:Uncharacterized protein n=1 Tax=Paraburkholderia tuberum TaxID=157910 RepID=A0A1H1JSB8_9BURK|nr:hypothetical protein [Paraburkholderia tuberum]SDR52838.1 hypothetical protein SAMN05445850_5555 [Paraburkholderia tuberum]